jgi:hypothetical protein
MYFFFLLLFVQCSMCSFDAHLTIHYSDTCFRCNKDFNDHGCRQLPVAQTAVMDDRGLTIRQTIDVNEEAHGS